MVKRKVGALFVAFFSTLALFATLVSTSGELGVFSFAHASDKNLTLTLDENNAPTNEAEYQNSISYTGINHATFSFTKVKAADGALCTLDEGGTITKDEAKGLVSIVVNFTGALELQTGITKTYDETKTLENNTITLVCGNYFKLKALEETTITSLTIKYSCLVETLDHTYLENWEVETPSTGTVEGTEFRLCTVCNHKQTRKLPLLNAIGLEIAQEPEKVNYIEGEYFSTVGMVINLIYSDNSRRQIVDYSYSPTGALTRDVTEVVITYLEYQVTQTIHVEPVDLRIEITAAPNKTDYVVGENIDDTGMEVSKIEYGVTTLLDPSEYTVVSGENLSIGSIPEVVLNDDTTIRTRIPAHITETIDVKMSHVTPATGSGVGYAANEKLRATALNNDYVSNFEEGDTVTFSFNSRSSGKSSLFIKSASTYVTEYSSVSNSTWFYPTKMGSVQANKLFDVYVNDFLIQIPDSVIYEGEETSDPNGDVLLLAKWKNLEMNNIDLIHGVNTIKITFKEQIYKNADVTLSTGTTKYGVLSSPVLDTVSLVYNCEAGVYADHTFETIFSDEYIANPGSCTEKRSYYKSCFCGQTAEQLVVTDYFHNIVSTVSESTNAQGEQATQTVVTTCECGLNKNHTATTSTIGVLKTNANYKAGSENYIDLGTEHIIGSNDLNSISDTLAKNRLVAKGDRVNATTLSSSSSGNVTKAIKKSCGNDYITNFYNGAGVQVEFEAQEAGYKLIVLKLASARTMQTAFVTGDMQFNLVADLYFNSVLQNTPDSYVLKGADGRSYNNDYGIAHANWTYLTYQVYAVPGVNTIKMISKMSYLENGNVVYFDTSRDDKNTTPSTFRFDSIAIY